MLSAKPTLHARPYTGSIFLGSRNIQDSKRAWYQTRRNLNIHPQHDHEHFEKLPLQLQPDLAI